jgi:hypothetical protein
VAVVWFAATNVWQKLMAIVWIAAKSLANKRGTWPLQIIVEAKICQIDYQ